MERERPTIRAEEVVIYVGLAVIGALRVIHQVSTGAAWGPGATLGLALLILGALGLVARVLPRIGRSRP
jgi:MYXO-CTERM domain-containing protein